VGKPAVERRRVHRLATLVAARLDWRCSSIRCPAQLTSELDARAPDARHPIVLPSAPNAIHSLVDEFLGLAAFRRT
jgi:hypothetical protein